ncbi:hypothetical protein CSB45_12425 [candidate division KSB3 bacterium]|uniref:AB hydrolase-1 domain-containing protein n=1 Tax=candidate division KSB3 bacterium TaxID=2044937 RepID=A0A2G6E356_9BACT|nr:MAG: hypothetical protein CSB45_12425 [candidate division KSB3 bacterium]PIE28701.1 MAG: hypothetical protein CSA57_12405 [candidate division KSB3 bacterium]
MPSFIHRSHRLCYREEGKGPLLLLLPGNTASSACYDGELNYFSSYFRTVSLDFWGTGQSDRIEGAWPEDWWEIGAQDAAALIKHLGEKNALVLGTSGGAITALLMAMLFPQHVQAVVADSCIQRYPAALLRMVVAERRQRSEKQIAFWKIAHGSDWERVIEADSECLQRLSMQGDLDWTQGRLRNIRCPVLLTASLLDRSLPDVGRKICGMAEQIPESRVLLINGGDHPLMWSRREDFFHVCIYFLKEALKKSRE